MIVDAECQNCRATLPTTYTRLGAAEWCDACLRFTVPQIRSGASIPASGRALTFKDFQQLLGTPEYRPEVKPLLEEWFGYYLSENGEEALVLNSQDEAVDPLWLHLKIQDSSAMQTKLYNTAMVLWR